MENKNKMQTAEELDALHDSGADMTAYLDNSTTHRPGLKTQRVNVDFPQWMIASLDREAERLGVTRQSIIKVWISTHFEDRPLGSKATTGANSSEIARLSALGMTSAEIGKALGIPLLSSGAIKAKLGRRRSKQSI